MKKRTWRTILLVLVLVFVTCTAQAKPLPAEAAAECVSTNPGQTVEYRLFLTGNPGLAGFRFQLTYDTKALTPVTFENSAEIDCTRGEFFAGGSLSGAKTASGCRFVWYATENAGQDGILLTFRFRVAEDALPGTYPVRLTCNPWDMADQNGSPVAVECRDGEVEVHRYRPMLYCDSLTVRQGEEFDCAVRVQDNPGVAGMQLLLALDRDRFELVKDSGGVPLCTVGESFSTGSFQVKGGAAALKAFWYQPRDSHASGVLFTVRFRAKTDAKLGDVPIRLEARELLNENEQPVSLELPQAMISLRTDAEVELKQLSDRELKMTAKSNLAKYAVTAVYDGDGRMTEMAVAEFSQKTASGTLNARQPLKGSTCKVMLLDAQYVPVCPALVRTAE